MNSSFDIHHSAFFIGLFLLLGCSAPAPSPVVEFASPVAQIAPSPPRTGELPTLAATYTPPPTFAPLPTLTPPEPRATAVPATPIPFEETVLEMRYAIPGLALDRRLQGNLAGQIIIVDETTGLAVQRNNQAGALLELRQALPQTELFPLPEGCDFCVYLTYELVSDGESDEGWLQDPVFLASVENYMAVALGPHFPPDTVLGLRRSASPYVPAHTLALTADGRLWLWLATDAQLDEPLPPELVAPQLPALLETLPIAGLDEQYVVDCSRVPIETLFLNPGGEEQTIRIVCPEFSLPATMLPLYLQLDALLAEKTAAASLPRPESAFPLAALLDYKRVDGARLTLYQDGRMTAVDAAAAIYTGTLTTTHIISLTTSLLDSDLLQPGLQTFMSTATVTETAATEPLTTSVLVVRGPDGLYDGEWAGAAGLPALAELDALLDSIITPPPAEPETTETPISEPTITPTVIATTAPTATP